MFFFFINQFGLLRKKFVISIECVFGLLIVDLVYQITNEKYTRAYFDAFLVISFLMVFVSFEIIAIELQFLC
jgi:hypothetical protein